MKFTTALALTITLAISALAFLSPFGLEQTALAAPCARFYKEKDNRGASFSVCLTNSDTVPRGFDNHISSINIPKGEGCILFTKPKFKGQLISYKGPTGRNNLPPEFNNKVSSIQCNQRF